MKWLQGWATKHWQTLALLVIVLIGLFVSPKLGLALGSGSLLVGATVNVNDDIIKYLIKQGVLDAAGGPRLNIKAKTADYTILAASDPSGTVFTNRGAGGTVIFTLPAAAAALAGVFYEFLGVADQTITVAPPVADTLLVVNDVAADSLTISTSAHKIGAHMRVVCDGTTWAAYGDSVGDTFTVAT